MENKLKIKKKEINKIFLIILYINKILFLLPFIYIDLIYEHTLYNIIQPKITIFSLLLNKVKYLTNIPKISIFLPIYNKAKYLERSIGSIQKQTLKNIEIIPVNDYSEDNSIDILMEMAKNDLRIKIVNNTKNRGLLYSRAMGILNSKGEYLMNLDPDDELKDPNTLEFLYNKTKKTKVDIITYGFIRKDEFQIQNFTKCKNYDYIQHQPDLFNSSNAKDDYMITNKLIKKKVLLKAYKIFKKKIFLSKWNYGEDEIWSILVNKYANSMICVNKTIFIYYTNNDSLTRVKDNILYLTNLIYWLEMLIIILNNKKYEKYLINRISLLINIIKDNSHLIYTIKKNKEIKDKYLNIFKYININYNYTNKIINKLIYSLYNN